MNGRPWSSLSTSGGASPPACPRCGDTDVYQMLDSKTGDRQKDFRWRCRGCEKQYTCRSGTVMEDSPIPMMHWCRAFWLACSSKKGISAKQIQRTTGLTYKSALYMMIGFAGQWRQRMSG